MIIMIRSLFVVNATAAQCSTARSQKGKKIFMNWNKKNEMEIGRSIGGESKVHLAYVMASFACICVQGNDIDHLFIFKPVLEYTCAPVNSRKYK